MNQDAVLERLYVELLGRDDDLQKSLANALKLSQETAKAIEKNMGTAFNVARESSGQFTREYSKAMRSAAGSTDRIAQEIERLNAQMKQNHEAIRTGNISQEEYRRILRSQRDEMSDLMRAYNQVGKGVQDYGQSTSQASRESKELDERIKALSDAVRISRSDWASRIISDEQFRESTERLHREIWELRNTSELTGDQMKKMAGDMAFAQRGLDSVNKVASRGGLAWTAQIGIADAFGNSLRNLGPAGNAAAGGLRIAQTAFQAFGGPLDLTNAGIRRLLGNMSRLTLALPALAAAASITGAAALHRMAVRAAEMSTELEVAAHRTGLNVEALQEYHYAAEQAGIGTERFNTVAQRLLRRAADAQAGNKSLAQTFRQLGVSIEDADGKLRSAEDMLGQVADGLFRVENQGERVAAAFKLMDTDGSIMLNFLSRGSAGIAEMREEARQLGLVISGDAIMSMSEYGNQVQRLERQFEVARTEIAAAFLPVLRDVVVPLINQVVIPALQNAAANIRDFSLAFTETGPVGEAFRKDTISNISALLELGNTALAVVQGVLTATNAIAMIPAYLGGATRGAIDAIGGGVMDEINAQREAMETNLAQMQAYWERYYADDPHSEGARALRNQMAELHAEMEALPSNAMEYIQRAASAGAEVFTDGIIRNATAMFDTLGRDVAGELEALVESAFGNLGPAADPPARQAGEDAGDSFTDGFDNAVADDPLSSVRLWTNRLAYELEQGIKGPMRVARLLAPNLEWLVSERDRLFAAGEFGSEDWDLLISKIQLVESLLDSVTGMTPPVQFPQPDEGAGGENLLPYSIERQEAEAARAARIAEEMERKKIAAHLEYQAMRREQDEYLRQRTENSAAAEILLARQSAQAQADAYRDVFLAIQEVDEATLRAAQNSETLRNIVARLNTEFKQPAPDEGQGGEFTDVYARLAGELSFIEAQALAFGDAIDANSLKARAYEAAINSLLQGGVNPLSAGLQNLIADWTQLDKAVSAASKSRSSGTPGARGAFAADLEATREAALSAFTDVQARMDEFFGRNASEFDQMRSDVQAAFDAGTISAEDFARALADIDAAEAATRLVDTLGHIETGLHSIGGAVGGSIGDLAKNLGDAVGVAKQFASGDITGGIISTVTMIAGGISDMIAANGEWARSVDQLSDRYRNLSRETVEALTKSRTETRWFLFIPYKVRVVDESATSEAMRVAQDFLSALDGALKSADFGADFNLGIDRLIQTEIINGFMLSPEIQAAITAFTAAMEAGDLNLARGIYEGIEAATRRQHEVLREMFPDLYRNTEAAKDYADEMERANRATQDMLAAIAGNQLERAFATGAIGLERYARELQRLTQQGITSDYARQEQELRKLISEAREAQADPAYVRALEEQLATLGDAFRDALEQGAFEANQTIRDLLGTSVGVIQDVMRSAFDTSTVDDFLSNWSAGITDVTRRGLITAFLESAQMKTALDNIGQMIADAVLDGVVTESELKAIRDAYTAVGEDAAQFWEVLDRLGLGFDGLADTVDTLNDSMRNVPSIFKATQAQWDAMQPSIPSSAAFTASSSSAPAGATHVTEVHFHGDVYGLDDFDDKVNAAVGGRANRLNTSAYGRS